MFALRLLTWTLALGLALPGLAPAQPCPDGDADGICDVDDPCTNVASPAATNLRLRIRKILWVEGRQRVRIAGVVNVPTTPAIDPLAGGLRLVVRDAAALTTLDVMLPPGAYDPATERGWIANGAGTSWKYRDRAGSINGIMRAAVRRRDPSGGEVKVVAFGQNGLYPLPTTPPVMASIVIDAPTATTGQCAEGEFDLCLFRNQGAKLLCR